MFKKEKSKLAVLIAATFIFMANSANPPNGRTGAPGEGMCTNCHGGGGGGFDGDINLSGLPANANPGETYNLTLDVDVSSGSPMRAGFQLVALFDSNNSNAGQLANPDGSSTIMNASGRDYWEHNPAMSFGGGTNVSWDVEWTAPNVTDDITFYMISILANGSGPGGDKQIMNTSQTTIMGSDPITIDFLEQIDVDCAGASNGSVIAEPSGGVSPYEYLWSDGSTSPGIANVSAGNYSVTVTDANENTGVNNVTINEPDEIEDISDFRDVYCFGGSDGIIVLSPTGGTGTISCLWSDGFDECSREELVAGSYSVELTDENECTTTFQYEINEPDELTIELDATSSSALEDDGQVTVLVNGGIGPYFFFWSNGIEDTGFSSTITDLSAGTYSVSVSDQNECLASAEIEVLSTGCDLSVSASIQNTSCNGLNDGAITLDVINANHDVEYLWSNGETTATLENLFPGRYTITVNDGACADTLDVDVIQPDSLIAGLVLLAKPSCAETTNGRLAIAVSGGTGNYDLSWNTGQTNDTIVMGMDQIINIPDTLVNIGIGTYVYTLSDNNGCTLIDSIVIDNGDNIPPFLMVENNFTIELDSSGFAPALSFEDIDMGSMDNCGLDTIIFSTPQFDCSNIGANIYTVTMIDTNGNSVSDEVEVLVVETIAPEILCPESIVSNSCSAIFYDIPVATDNCEIPNVSLVSGLQPGSIFPAGTNQIEFEAIDACGNIARCTFEIEVTNDLVAVVENLVNADCGTSTGSVQFAASGGTPPYNLVNGSSLSASGLAAGNYTYQIVDSDGCVTNVSFSIGQADSDIMLLDLNLTYPSCNGLDDGSVQVGEITGGDGNYTIDYGVDDPLSLSIGSYTLVITDGNGCSLITEYTIEEPPIFETIILDSGFDPCTGEFNENDLMYDAVGGSPPYNLDEVLIVFDSIENVEIVIINLSDTQGCTTNVEVEAPDVNPIIISSSQITNQTDAGNGGVDIEVEGGNGALSYTWTDNTGNVVSNEQDLIGVMSGDYVVSIVDERGCEVSNSFFIDVESSLAELDNDLYFMLMPNPVGDYSIIKFSSEIATELNIYNSNGLLISKESDLNLNTQLDMSQITPVRVKPFIKL